MVVVFLERPIGRRRHDQIGTPWLELNTPAVAVVQSMDRRQPLDGILNAGASLRILRYRRKCLLRLSLSEFKKRLRCRCSDKIRTERHAEHRRLASTFLAAFRCWAHRVTS